MRSRRNRISIFGNFGSPNPGNESTLLAILSRLRLAYPDCEINCICLHPQVVAQTAGIEGVSITTREARIWDRRVPLARRVPMAFVGASLELLQYVRAFKALKGSEMLIVPGTGLVTDAFGIDHWGPYNQFKWVLAAKLRRCRILYVSIGAGPITSTAGRALVRAAFSLADYRSYRDDASRDWLTRIGFSSERDPIYPDLVFGLPGALLPSVARQRGARRAVGLGLMVYAGRYSAADPRPDTYKVYLESLADLAIWLLEHDYDIRLLLGDNDTVAIEDFRSILRTRMNGYDEERIIEQPITSIHDVLAEIAATDVVVATRFHNVLLAMLLNKPVIAISFHHKCSSLMSEMNLSEYCHEIHEMDTDRLIGQFQQLEQDEETVMRKIGVGLDKARAAIDEQYDLILTGT